MYVIATVFCSNFHFSVSLHVPFSQFLFERDSYSNAYLLAKFRFDTAENEPVHAARDDDRGGRACRNAVRGGEAAARQLQYPSFAAKNRGERPLRAERNCVR